MDMRLFYYFLFACFFLGGGNIQNINLFKLTDQLRSFKISKHSYSGS